MGRSSVKPSGRSSGRASRGGARGVLLAYLDDSRDLFTSIVLVMPLFIFYQLGVLATGGMRNGVDFVTSTLFSLLGGNLLYYAGFNLVALVAFGVALGVLRKNRRVHPRLFPWMLLESTLYALCFGSLVVWLIQAVGLGALLSTAEGQPMGLVDKLVMSAGAGLYEEIVFRLFLMGGIFAALTRVAALSRVPAAVIAVASSSLIFSAAHHISEPFTLSAFTFRVFAGGLFAALYHVRGFAIAAYTHCFYDVYVMVFRNDG